MRGVDTGFSKVSAYPPRGPVKARNEAPIRRQFVAAPYRLYRTRGEVFLQTSDKKLRRSWGLQLLRKPNLSSRDQTANKRRSPDRRGKRGASKGGVCATGRRKSGGMGKKKRTRGDSGSVMRKRHIDEKVKGTNTQRREGRE